jgi:hypothetical protein
MVLYMEEKEKLDESPEPHSCDSVFNEMPLELLRPTLTAASAGLNFR